MSATTTAQPLEPDAGRPPAVRAVGLSKRYGDVVAVEALDLAIPRGSVFGLLGQNGAGKTTTFGVLCGFVRPTAGAVEVLGEPASRLHLLRGRVAALPQDAALAPRVPVVEQLIHFACLMGWPRARAREEARRCLRRVGLEEVARRPGGELSHGMHKRAGLAQALLGDPELLFLDEPTAGLDPKSAREVKDLIAALRGRATVVLASHNLAEVQELCTDAAIIHRGRLRTQGTMAELTQQSAQLVIELADTQRVPIATLRSLFGEQAVHLEAQTLRIVYSPDTPPERAVHQSLMALLQAGAPVLSVNRGVSLEKAFLSVTEA